MTTDPYRRHPRVRIFESMLKDVIYKYRKPLPATRENLRKARRASYNSFRVKTRKAPAVAHRHLRQHPLANAAYPLPIWSTYS